MEWKVGRGEGEGDNRSGCEALTFRSLASWCSLEASKTRYKITVKVKYQGALKLIYHPYVELNPKSIQYDITKDVPYDPCSDGLNWVFPWGMQRGFWPGPNLKDEIVEVIPRSGANRLLGN